MLMGIDRKLEKGGPVAQKVKRWPTDVAVPCSSPACGENLSERTCK